MQPIRFHHLKAAGRSLAHARASLDGTEGDETYAIERGSGVHALLFGTTPVVGYEKTRRGKEWEAFEADHPGHIILTANEYAKADAMAEAVRACPLAMRVLDGEREKTLYWTLNGRACRTTPDVRAERWVTELKTCATADPFRFTGQAIRMAYHAQIAWQLEADAAMGGEAAEGYIVAVESAPPFPVTVLRLTDRALEQGARLWRLWWERLMTAEQSDQWPPYSQSIVDLDVPEEHELVFGDEEAA